MKHLSDALVIRLSFGNDDIHHFQGDLAGILAKLYHCLLSELMGGNWTRDAGGECLNNVGALNIESP